MPILRESVSTAHCTLIVREELKTSFMLSLQMTFKFVTFR
jgi:hypothetical protein